LRPTFTAAGATRTSRAWASRSAGSWKRSSVRRHRPHARAANARWPRCCFTDIVGSTERAGEIGDAAWRALLDEHDAVAARAVQSAGGSLVKTTGDGVLATFAGPSHAMAAVRELQESAVLLGVSIRAGCTAARSNGVPMTSAASGCTSRHASPTWRAAAKCWSRGRRAIWRWGRRSSSLIGACTR